MDTRKIKAAAQLLLAARNHEVTLAHLPDEHLPSDVAEAYAIQDEIMQSLGPVGGWKLAARTADALPSCAPMPAQCMFAVPYHFFDLLMTGERGVDVDVAVRMKHDLPPRAKPYTWQEVRAAVATVHPALAMVSPRYAAATHAYPLLQLADALSLCAVMYGPGRSDLRQIDQGMSHTELYFNGLDMGSAADNHAPAVEIWSQLTWLANHLGTRCGGLKAGQFIVTGSRRGAQAAETSAIGAMVAQLGAASRSLAQA